MATNQYHSGTLTPDGGELKRSALDQSMGRAGFGFGVRNPSKDISLGFVAYWENDLVFNKDSGITNKIHLGGNVEIGQHRFSLDLDNTLVTPEGTDVLLASPPGATIPGQKPNIEYVDTRGAETPSLSHGITSATFGYEFSQDIGNATLRLGAKTTVGYDSIRSLRTVQDNWHQALGFRPVFATSRDPLPVVNFQLNVSVSFSLSR